MLHRLKLKICGNNWSPDLTTLKKLSNLVAPWINKIDNLLR